LFAQVPTIGISVFKHQSRHKTNVHDTSRYQMVSDVKGTKLKKDSTVCKRQLSGAEVRKTLPLFFFSQLNQKVVQETTLCC
jgi:hypothetical protein